MSRFAFTVRRILGTVVLLAIVVLLANTFVTIGWLRPLVVAGDSMAPHYAPGSQALVDRSTSSVSRWDVVVARSPLGDPSRIIKRVVGLPGERLTIREGDIWIDDRRVVKSPAEQSRLRMPTDQPVAHSLTELTVASVTDSLRSNDRISRRLNRVADLMIETELHCKKGSTWSVRIADRFVMEIAGNGEARLLGLDGKCLERATLASPSPWKVMVSSFDRAALLMVEGTSVFSRSEVAGGKEGTETPFAIEISGRGPVEMRELSIWRDVYYEAMPVAGSPATGPSEATWELGPEDFFVVGDNQAVSVDSRHWGGISRRLIEGTVR